MAINHFFESAAFFNRIGWVEILVIFLAVLLLFGGKKLPELARGLGKALRIFKKEVKSVKDEFEDSLADEEGPDEDKTDSSDKT